MFGCREVVAGRTPMPEGGVFTEGRISASGEDGTTAGRTPAGRGAGTTPSVPLFGTGF